MSDSWSQCWDPLRPSVRATQSLLQLARHSTLYFCSVKGHPCHWALIFDVERHHKHRVNPNPVNYNATVWLFLLLLQRIIMEIWLFLLSVGKDNWGTLNFHSTQKENDSFYKIILFSIQYFCLTEEMYFPLWYVLDDLALLVEKWIVKHNHPYRFRLQKVEKIPESVLGNHHPKALQIMSHTPKSSNFISPVLRICEEWHKW